VASFTVTPTPAGAREAAGGVGGAEDDQRFAEAEAVAVVHREVGAARASLAQRIDLATDPIELGFQRGRLLRLDGPSVRTKHLPPDELGADDKVTSSSSRVSGTTAAELPEPTRRPPRQRHTHTSARRGTLLGAQRSGGVVLVLIGLGLGSIRSGGGLPGCAPTRTRSVCLCVSTRERRWQSHSDIETNGCEHRP
jgi:hypothetical protein